MEQKGNEAMNLAWQFVEGTDVSVFLTGKAGTGKTTFLRRVRELSPKRMVVVAPTGVAAINAQGVTIHSFFQLPLGVHVPGMEYKEQNHHFRMGKEKKNIMRTMDLLVIDEVSMVRADLLDAIDGVLRKYRDRSLPFGGVQLLLIGDLQQLAPVAQDSEWDLLKDYYDSPYFFSSHTLRQLQYVTIELQHIYRQRDEHFIRLLADIREGRPDAATLSALNRRYIPDYQPAEQEESIRLTTHNYMANRYNNQQLAALPTEAYHFEAQAKGDFPETSYPADADLVLKVGAQVMFLKNSTQGDYYNGKIGRVAGFGNDTVKVACRTDEAGHNGSGATKLVEVEPANWENTRLRINEQTKEIEEEVVGTFRQYPLRLAWAITVHKSQGLTFDHAVLDINEAFAHGQVYVALSRCRSLEGLVLTRPVQLKTLLPDPAVTGFLAATQSNDADNAAKLPNLRRRFFSTLLDELFSFRRLQQEMRYVVRVLQEHLSRQQQHVTAAWEEAAHTMDNGCMAVALKFRQQYERILNQSTDYQHDPLLQERIGKAATYFAQQLHSMDHLLELSKMNIGNKAVKRQFDNAFETFKMDFLSKEILMEQTVEHGFSVRTYLKDKALSLLTEEQGLRRKKTKAEKEKKEKTWEQSLRLLKEGKSVDEIAVERGLTPNTIYQHLSRYVELGELHPLDFLPEADIQMVHSALGNKHLPDTPGDLGRILPHYLPYNELLLIYKMLRG